MSSIPEGVKKTYTDLDASVINASVVVDKP